MQWDNLMHRLGSKRYASGVATVAASQWQILGEVGLVHAQWRRTENSRLRRTRSVRRLTHIQAAPTGKLLDFAPYVEKKRTQTLRITSGGS